MSKKSSKKSKKIRLSNLAEIIYRLNKVYADSKKKKDLKKKLKGFTKGFDKFTISDLTKEEGWEERPEVILLTGTDENGVSFSATAELKKVGKKKKDIEKRYKKLVSFFTEDVPFEYAIAGRRAKLQETREDMYETALSLKVRDINVGQIKDLVDEKSAKAFEDPTMQAILITLGEPATK